MKITVEGEEKRLGEVLRSWVRDWCQSPLGEAQFHLDRLAALRRFWTYVHGQYSYRKTCEEPMKLGREETDA